MRNEDDFEKEEERREEEEEDSGKLLGNRIDGTNRTGSVVLKEGNAGNINGTRVAVAIGGNVGFSSYPCRRR